MNSLDKTKMVRIVRIISENLINHLYTQILKNLKTLLNHKT